MSLQHCCYKIKHRNCYCNIQTTELTGCLTRCVLGRPFMCSGATCAWRSMCTDTICAYIWNEQPVHKSQQCTHLITCLAMDCCILAFAFLYHCAKSHSRINITIKCTSCPTECLQCICWMMQCLYLPQLHLVPCHH